MENGPFINDTHIKNGEFVITMGWIKGIYYLPIKNCDCP
jgi:hypothetical protein